MDDLVPHPFASILFGLVVGALCLWQGFEENRAAWREAQSLSRPAIPTEELQVARLSQQIQSVPLRGEADIQPKRTKKIYYRVIVPDSGTLEAGDVVIKLKGIVASKADAQCPDNQGKNWPCGAAATTALRRLVRARAVVCDLPRAFGGGVGVSVRRGASRPTQRSGPSRGKQTQGGGSCFYSA